MAFISESKARSFFDEDFYLTNNPDVEAAVEAGTLESGFQHFLEFGLAFSEADALVRPPSEALTFFSEETYLAENPDVADAVANGDFVSGLEHFLAFGLNEGRSGTGYDFFDPLSYLNANADVANAVAEGGFGSALEHYLQFGFSEGRGDFFSLNNDAINNIVNEGDTLLFTVETNNGGVVGSDVEVEFSIAGDIDLGDIVGETLDGTAVIEAGSSSTTFEVELAEDLTTEDFEGLTVTASLAGFEESLSSEVSVNDSSVAPLPPAFIMTESANVVDEGETLTFTVGTEDGSAVSEDTEVALTLSGIDEADITGSLEQTATILAGESSADFSIELAEDEATEGLEGIVARAVVNGDTITADAVVNDTSIAEEPPEPTIAVEVAPNPVDEGGTATITVTTTNIADGETVDYAISGEGIDAEDFDAPLTGTIEITGNTGTLDLPVVEDVAEEGEETFTTALSFGEIDASIDTVINDTSVPDDQPTVAVEVAPNPVDEGGTATITVTTTNIADGETVDYAISGEGIDAEDFDAPLTGTIEITENTGSLELPIVEDVAEEGEETFTTALSFGEIEASIDTVINDTSVPDDGGEVISIPAGSTDPITGTADSDVFSFDLAAAQALDDNTQVDIQGFSVADPADSLELDLPDGVAADATTLDQVSGETLPNGETIAVQSNVITQETNVTFGPDANGDLIALTLEDVLDPAAVAVEVV
ncbi:hypothetical protein PCC7418_0072 [Halothece sp. PCC 7418]|uniref:hypothetical protein n=1 Tax=Halothece sp. (strain PCC 7418) TaxID=65093 RepID=UPI0002A0701C|nr:hypothetical protein [Halothece sp. PCC 7418]AFZ42321.1 hypothetical protein PCC7418_0072 [Halothece sp. PCC 7418]